MKLSLAVLLGAFLLVAGNEFPDEPIEHDFTNHIVWFQDTSDECLKECHHDCESYQVPALHVGCMLGCMDKLPKLCEKSNVHKIAHRAYLAAQGASGRKRRMAEARPKAFFGEE